MISFDEIEKVFSYDTAKHNDFCIEIEFNVFDDLEFKGCWMGKMPDKENEGKFIYWYGLKEDGSGAYDYNNFENFASDPVFKGKSLKDISSRIELLSIDGCKPEERLPHFLK